MGIRGFSLVSGLIVVAALLASVVLVPMPLLRASRTLGQAQLDTTRSAARIACLGICPGALFRLARARLAPPRPAPPQAGAMQAAMAQGSGASAPSPPRTRVARPWEPLAEGIEYRVVDAGTVQMHQVRMNPALARLGGLYAPSQGSARQAVGIMARRAGAVAAINASYFDADDHPLGYLKLDGRVLVPDVATGAAFTAMFCMSGARASIVPRERFRAGDARLVLQAGPRLVVDGRPTRGLRETRSFRQSGIAVTREGRVVIYATDGSYLGLTWEQTRQILLGPEAEGGIAPRDVLNLDGGSSSQLYVRVPGRAPVLTGMATSVPVGLAFFARSPRR